MRIILQENIVNLGKVGDQVTVKAGYGRNFLVPQGKAALANKNNIAEFEKHRAELEKAAQVILDAAQKRADALSKVTVTIEAQAGDEGKLFGSIGPRDIAEAVAAQGVELEKKEVSLPEGPIRTTGEYDIAINLEGDVTSVIKLSVVAIATS